MYCKLIYLIRRYFKLMNVLYISFGMLLWELAFQKFPYKNMEISEIQKHVLSGKREILNLPLSSHGIEKEYGSIIKAGMIYLFFLNNLVKFFILNEINLLN